ncbi:MAG: DNA polymerase III subunit alpha [Pseudomonadota bacterium]
MAVSNASGQDSDAPAFVHLKVHSSYSLLEGALPIAKIAKLASDEAMPAVGLTDTGNLFGALEFSEKLAGAGIQPIVGVALSIAFESDAEDAGARPTGMRVLPHRRALKSGRLALLAMNETGYLNLMALVSRAHLQTGDTDDLHVPWEALQGDAATGLICLTGGPDGPIDLMLAETGKRTGAATRLAALQAVFGDRLYVELQRHERADGTIERGQESALIDLSYEAGVPLVATSDVYFATRDDHEAHDALMCIAEGTFVTVEERRRVAPSHAFASASQMAELFADIPEALANTVEIAQRCAYRPLGKDPILPKYVTAAEGTDEAQLKAEADELTRQAEEGLAARLASHGPADSFTREDYEKRLAFELKIIAGMKFPGYFLIVADFIKWAKAHGIAVGPGRGSGAGSLVAYSLTITDLDPLRFGLLFERFLNPERVSMPDFDIDFCQDRREEVIRYVQTKYGADRVAQIITHGKLQARAVLRDVGRVLQMPFGQVNRLTQMVPNNPANPVTLPEAIEIEPKLRDEADSDPTVERLLEIAQKLEGLYRHASTHAAGMVIGDRPLEQLVPLYRDPKSSFPITQFNWKMTEAAGLVKFDFLGLKTLTVLEKAVASIARRGITLDLASLPLDDAATYELLARADTAGVFQLESVGMRDALRKLKPDRFEDIIAMVSLYRPGPMDNIPTYINRKHGDEEVDYLHPMLKPVLEETHGVIIYQEQVQKIAQVMAGYSLGKADVLRRAMGKKDKAQMAEQQAAFVAGAVENGVKKEDAVYIFQLVDKFAGYGFNKSHAAAYALVAYHTAYLKANYPVEFLAASMSLDRGSTEKLAMFCGEARRAGIAILPPCVNASGVDFLPEEGAVRYALAALKNIGEAAVEVLVAEREADGRFADLSDFARRFDPKALNRRGLETLSAAGAFDGLEPDRARVHGNVEHIMALATRLASDSEAGTSDLFAAAAPASVDFRAVKRWTPMQTLQAEFDAVGFYLSGHPLDAYEDALAKLNVQAYTAFEAATERGILAATLGGIVVSVRERRSQKGSRFAYVMFSDGSGQFEAVIFSDAMDAAGDLLKPGTPVLINVEADREGETVRLRAQSVRGLAQAARSVSKGLCVVVEEKAVLAGAVLTDLSALLAHAAHGAGEGDSVNSGAGSARAHGEALGQIVLRFDVRAVHAAGAMAQQVGSGGGQAQPAVAADTFRQSVEVTLPGRYDVSPSLRGEVLTLAGVIDARPL